MSQPQDQVTHRLVTFIQSIQLRRGSGLLSVKRGEGASMEKGSFVFVNGQIIEAKVGRYTGSEAFNRLSMWENCQFSFIKEPVSQAERLNIAHTDALRSPPSTDALINTQPLSLAPEGSRKDPETSPYFAQFTITDEHSSFGGTGVPRPGRRLSAALQMIDLMGLSRVHRRLFLLIDGKRSIDELAPLVGRTSDEVSELLRDLERASVILMPNVSS